MSKKRIKRRNRGGGRTPDGQKRVLLTFPIPGTDPNEPCHCPICQELGIDLNDIDEYGAIEIESDEQWDRLQALMMQMNGTAAQA